MFLDDGSANTSQRPLHGKKSSTSLDTSIDQRLRDDGNVNESSSLVQQSYNCASNQPPTGTLTKTPHGRWILLAGDIMLSLTPILFLILASLSLYLNNQAKSAFGDKVKAMTSLSPTIFPIVYAAILGTALRRIALYHAEKSATLGTIERLVGCHSLFTTFETQIGLRRLDLLGVSLLLVWMLSPVGGQASLRLLKVTPRELAFNSTLLYYPVEAYSEAPMILSGTNAFSNWPFWAAPYMTALQTSEQTINSSMDLWRNVKLPDIKSVQGYEPSNLTTQWYNISSDDEVVYASLLGLPIIGMPESGNASFQLVSFYWSVECDAAKVDPVQPWKPTLPYLNTSALAAQSVWTFDLEVNSSAKDVALLTYQSRKSDNLAQTNTSTAQCRVEAPVIESRVECTNRDCGVRAMRKLSRGLNFASGRPMASLFTQTVYLVRADLGATQQRPRYSQPTEFFIAGWGNEARLVDDGWVEIANISAQLLSNRLQTVINTFWDASIGNSLRTANLTVEQPPSVCPLEYTGTCAERGFIWNTTTLHGTRFEGDQYICDVRFATIVILISCFLLLAANLSTLLGSITTVPDVLGFVSTAARDNPYFKGYVVPSHVDGIEAARLLRDVRVMVGDVDGKAEIGHVAFASMDMLPQRVTRKRLYH